MTCAIDKCRRSTRLLNMRALIGGGILGVIVATNAAVAYAQRMV